MKNFTKHLSICLVVFLLTSFITRIPANAAVGNITDSHDANGWTSTVSVTGSLNYNYTANTQYNSGGSSWISITQYSSYISYKVNPNTNNFSRSAKITLICGNNRLEVTINQAGATFKIDSSSHSTYKAAGSFSFSVTGVSPIDLKVDAISLDNRWLHVNKRNGINTWDVEYERNNDADKRDGRILVYGGGNNKYVYVYQSAQEWDNLDLPLSSAIRISGGYVIVGSPLSPGDFVDDFKTDNFNFENQLVLTADGSSVSMELYGSTSRDHQLFYRYLITSIGGLRGYSWGLDNKALLYNSIGSHGKEGDHYPPVMKASNDQTASFGAYYTSNLYEIMYQYAKNAEDSGSTNIKYPNSPDKYSLGSYAIGCPWQLENYEGSLSWNCLENGHTWGNGYFYYCFFFVNGTEPVYMGSTYDIDRALGTSAAVVGGGGNIAGTLSGSGGGSGNSGSGIIVWPDPIGNPDPRDFYLVPPGGGNYTVTYNAWNNADVYYSKDWITNRTQDNSKANFTISPNGTSTARDGSVRAQIGEHVVECIRYLQCANPVTYIVTLPEGGGSASIRLPNGYQYIEYGSLGCGGKPGWIDAPGFAQNKNRMPNTADYYATVTVSAAGTYSDRSGIVAITIGNERDGTYTVAYINVTQKGIPVDHVGNNMNSFPDPAIDCWAGPADGWDFLVTYGLHPYSTVEFIPPEMFTDISPGSDACTFTTARNSSSDARWGIANVFWNGAVWQTVNFLQCGQIKSIDVKIPQTAGSTTVALPYGYQFTGFGKLDYSYRPNWVSSVSFSQGDDGNVNSTITISAGATDRQRGGMVPVYFGNSGPWGGNYQIAVINLVQDVPTPAVPFAIWLSQTAATIETGDILSLSATISPAGTVNKTVTWSSSDELVAEVSDGGIITGVNPGAAIITAKTVNGLTAACTVTVADPVAPISTDTSHLDFDNAVSPEDGRQLIQVADGGKYSVAASDNWMFYNIDTTDLWVWCGANQSIGSRTGTLTIEGENGTSTIVTIKQKGTEVTNKDLLSDAISKAFSYLLDYDFYTEESFSVLTHAFSVCIMVFLDPAASQLQIDATSMSLFEAISNLAYVDEYFRLSYDGVRASYLIPGERLDVDANFIISNERPQTMYAALYNEYGYLIKLSSTEGEINGDIIHFSLSLDIPYDTQMDMMAVSLKAFVWDSQTFVPLREEFSFPIYINDFDSYEGFYE